MSDSIIDTGARIEPAPVAPSPTIDVSSREDVHRLRRNSAGLLGIIFLSLTGAAPLSGMLFNTPIMVGYGNGVGVPATYVVVTCILVVFGVAYVAMARKVTAAGGFYSFISHGLGQTLGAATGFMLVAAYAVFEVALVGGFAYFAVEKLSSYGVHVAWYVPAFAMIAAVATLSYFDVKLSVKVLGVALVAELLALLVFDVAVFTSSASHVNTAALNPLNAFKGLPAGEFHGSDLAPGAAGIGLFFAFWSWVGWESAQNYAEEAREPEKNIPRALYAAVIGCGVLYALTSWAALSSYPSTDAAAYVGQTNAAEMFFGPAQQFSGSFLKGAFSWLIITSSFACGMSFHNTTSRYLFALGRERILPRGLARTHGKHQSPHIASFTQSAIAAVVILLFVLFAPVDPELGASYSVAYVQVFGLMAVMGVVALLSIQALVAIAVFRYFRVHQREDHHWWKTVTAPILAAISQVVVVYLAISNLDFLGAEAYSYTWWLLAIDVVIFVGGLAYAAYVKQSKPEKYAVIGRMIDKGIA